VLVFLPGMAEICRVLARLEEALGEQQNVLLTPLYGDLDLAAQRRAIEPAPAGQRKIVLATAIAEHMANHGVKTVALIGFAGPRVIEQTVREKLPPGFQRSEFLLDHGALDMIVSRGDMRDRLASILAMLTGAPAPEGSAEVVEV